MSSMDSYQNLVLLQNLYKLKAMGFEYIDSFDINHKSSSFSISSVDELVKNISNCYLCDLSKSRKQSMVGFGSFNANLMIVDFGVSDIQDLKNSYYVGLSGEILTNMIQNVLGLNLNDVYYTHQVKCKAHNLNTPSVSEINSCSNYLFTQIELIKPKVIVTLGESAYNNLVGKDEKFENVRGHDINFRNAKLIPIYHPQFLLRNPHLKRETLKDLKRVKSFL